MAIQDFTFRHLTSEGQDGDFSEAQQKSIIRLLPQMLGEEEIKATPQLLNKIYTKIIESIEGESLVWIPISDLVEMKEPVTQAPINPGKVYNVLAGDDGLLKGNALIKPLLVGVVPGAAKTEAVLEGGRHRLSAVVSLFKFFGFTDEQIGDLKLPCFVMVHNVRRIVADNTSRGATRYEKDGVTITAELDGIDLNNPLSIWERYKAGDFPGTPTSQRSKAMRLTFVAATEDNNTENLTRETRGAIAAALPTKWNHLVKDTYGYALKDTGFLIDLMQYTAHHLNEVVAQMKTAGVTNIARSTGDISYKLVKMAVEAIKKGELNLPPKPEKPAPAPVATVKAEPKAKRARTRKADNKNEVEGVTI